MPFMLDRATERAVSIPPHALNGDLVVPENATGLVIFAHGSGSSRLSSRNRYVARELNRGRLATLLMDLLTEDEERIDMRTRHLRFDIGMLADRLVNAAEWSGRDPDVRHLTIGYFGASTGGGAALVAAADRPLRVGAVVSRGGRPDLAGAALARVTAPTLLIVGGEDYPVIEMNEEAMRALRCEKRMEIVRGATHLFEEPGTLERVAELAREWFQRHLVSSR
ncbi:MAG TPA: dienelactone hydrolase family protein [Bryobacteraceae bacterium]|nr:dienelactone hydrolase family protein [Bryobacteraceae bacterium]